MIQNTTGLGSQEPGVNNCIWLVKLGGYINIMSSLIISGGFALPSFSTNESVTNSKTKKSERIKKFYASVHVC